jgi:hypothetical protein
VIHAPKHLGGSKLSLGQQASWFGGHGASSPISQFHSSTSYESIDEAMALYQVDGV